MRKTMMMALAACAAIAEAAGPIDTVEMTKGTAGGKSETRKVKLTADGMRVRDPFVVPDAERGVYCLVSSYFAKPGERGGDGLGFLGDGVQFYESRDLVTWSEPRQVLAIPPSVDCRAFWAPEVHRYKDKWYVFGTVNYRSRKAKGTWTFVSDDLRGPYRPIGTRSITPPEWESLDGTLWVEDGTPWMVFCHEWCQTGNGRMMAAPMSKDLARFTAEPVELFRAADVPRATHVTDGPFLLAPKGEGLRMIWSNFLTGSGYCVLQAKSQSGKVAGPWVQLPPVYTKDGGHGMCFTRFDGQLMLSLHQPNRSPHERLHLYPIKMSNGLFVRDVASSKTED